MADEKKKLVITIANGGNNELSTVGMTVANAAMSKGMDVAVFLTANGVELSIDGATDLTHVAPFKRLEELIDAFLDAGGTMWACTPCFKHRGLKEEETHEKAIVTGAGPMLEWVASGASTLTF